MIYRRKVYGVMRLGWELGKGAVLGGDAVKLKRGIQRKFDNEDWRRRCICCIHS
jgi:hypothetical protein